MLSASRPASLCVGAQITNRIIPFICRAKGQTILIAQGADGEQQCVYVAEDGDDLGMEDGSNGVLAVDGSLVGE